MGAESAIDPAGIRHAVQFYGDDADLVDAVSGYLATAIGRGDVALIIATADHVRSFDAGLQAGGIDPDRSRRRGTLVTLEAENVLARFVVGGRPDPAAFDAVVGDLVRDLRSRGGRPAAYGEMVAELWRRGNIVAALELEQLWNDLLEREDFSLFCAYPASLVGEAAVVFADVCRLHSQILGRAVPTTDVREASRAFSCAEGAPSEVRRFAAKTLEAWRCRSLIEDVAIVVSELASNAVRHAATDFVVTISLGAGTIRIAVEDGSRVSPRIHPTSAQNAWSGHGLVLVGALATSWGVDQIDGVGKVVWVEFREGAVRGG